MDNYYSSPRHRKMIALHGHMPISPGTFSHPSIDRNRHKPFPKTPPLDPYPSSRYGNLMKLLQSNSPASVLDNIGPMTPVKMNMAEGTLLVDVSSVESSSRGFSSINSNGRRPVYRIPDDSIRNLRASKHRLTLGNEGLQRPSPSHFSIKNSFSEADTMAAAEFEAQKSMAASPPRPAKIHEQTSVEVPAQDWSPVDDGIVVPSPSQSREDIDSSIHHSMYGVREFRRLPVFTEITHQ